MAGKLYEQSAPKKSVPALASLSQLCKASLQLSFLPSVKLCDYTAPCSRIWYYLSVSVHCVVLVDRLDEVEVCDDDKSIYSLHFFLFTKPTYIYTDVLS